MVGNVDRHLIFTDRRDDLNQPSCLRWTGWDGFPLISSGLIAKTTIICNDKCIVSKILFSLLAIKTQYPIQNPIL